MRRSVLFGLFCAILISVSTQQQTLGSISDKFRRAAPAAFAGLGGFVTGLKAFGFYEEASFSRAQIETYLHATKTYSMELGTSRLLRFRGFRGPSRISRPVFRAPVGLTARFHAPVVRAPVGFAGRFVALHRAPARPAQVAAAPSAFGGASISFKPWHGIAALKFGTSYSHIAMDSAIHFPGTTWVKASGIVAVRQGDTIHTKVGYGWVAGSGKQLTTATKVRRCRRRWFRTRCWDDWITIPRGVNANELHSVSDGMNHLLFNKIADVSGCRLLRSSEKPSSDNGQTPMPNKKMLSGVERHNILAALEVVGGKKINQIPAELLSGQEIAFDGHIVQAVHEKDSELFTLFVQSH
jgi:hypothetical protein